MFHLNQDHRNHTRNTHHPVMNRFMYGPPSQLPTPKKSNNVLSLLQSPKLHQGLGQVQQVLQIVQSTAPIIQEYGTMIKNLPAMYRIVKALKNAENLFDDEGDDDQTEVEKVQSHVKDTTAANETKTTIARPVKTNRTSQPKLYI